MQTEPATNFPMIGIYLFAAQWIFNIGLAAWVYFRNADSANTKSINLVARDLDNFIMTSQAVNEVQNMRLVSLETTVGHLPTSQSIQQLASDVAANKAQLQGVIDMVKSIERQTRLISEHLLSNKK